MSETKRIMLIDSGPGSRYFGEPPAIEAVEDVLKFVEKELEDQNPGLLVPALPFTDLIQK